MRLFNVSSFLKIGALWQDDGALLCVLYFWGIAKKEKETKENMQPSWNTSYRYVDFFLKNKLRQFFLCKFFLKIRHQHLSLISCKTSFNWTKFRALLDMQTLPLNRICRRFKIGSRTSAEMLWILLFLKSMNWRFWLHSNKSASRNFKLLPSSQSPIKLVNGRKSSFAISLKAEFLICRFSRFLKKRPIPLGTKWQVLSLMKIALTSLFDFPLPCSPFTSSIVLLAFLMRRW